VFLNDVDAHPLPSELERAYGLQKKNFVTGQNERDETTQNTTVTKSAACASYKSN
jgi:hypothetical protein